MSRLVMLLLLVSACKKKETQAPDPQPAGSAAAPSRGMSVTKVKGSGDTDEPEGGSGGRLAAALDRAAGSDTGDTPAPTNTPPAPVDAGAAASAPEDAKQTYGGDGSPPYIDDAGYVKGPGGPLFMGRGAECNAERNHCLREPAWFAVGNLVAGKLYRAVPIFEFEKKWYNWRGKEEDFAMRLRTKVGTKETLRVGEPVIWFIDENSSRKFVFNDYDAHTSSRWEAGVIESISGDKIRVKGWTYGAVPIDTTRIVVETKTK